MLLDQFDSLEQCDPNGGETDLKVEQNESDIEEQVLLKKCMSSKRSGLLISLIKESKVYSLVVC